ncbi:MAG: hypothetical protein II129_00235, partial [Paludibacteraceae bacterium]|nr:hypothetical protein [Paludibacteraceae bacterium]
KTIVRQQLIASATVKTDIAPQSSSTTPLILRESDFLFYLQTEKQMLPRVIYDIFSLALSLSIIQKTHITYT